MRFVGSLPSSVFRAKGLIEFADTEETMLFQYVCGRFELSVFPNPKVRDRFLTFIGSGNEPSIQDLLEAVPVAPAG